MLAAGLQYLTVKRAVLVASISSIPLNGTPALGTYFGVDIPGLRGL